MSDTPKRFLVRAFDSYRECEQWLNEQWPSYEPVSIADTRSNVTVLVRLQDPAPAQVLPSRVTA